MACEKLRSLSSWHKSMELFRLHADRFNDTTFHDRTIESAIELSKWEEAEELHTPRVEENPERKNMGFEFYCNDLILGFRNAVRSVDHSYRNRLIVELEERLDHVRLSIPLLIGDTIERHRNKSAVQRCLLANIEILLKWLKTPENREELEENVFAEWDKKRTFFKWTDQEFLLEKECTFLDVLTGSRLMSLKEHTGLKTLSSSLLAIAHLTRSSICAKRGDRTGALVQIKKSRSFASGAFECDIVLEEAKQSRLFNDHDRMTDAYIKLAKVCEDKDLLTKQVSCLRCKTSETLSECFIQLARFTNRYDYDVGGMKGLKVDSNLAQEISKTRFTKTSNYFSEAIQHARDIQNGAKCTAYYRYGLYLECHFRNNPNDNNWNKSVLLIRDNFEKSLGREKLEQLFKVRERMSRQEQCGINIVKTSLANYAQSIMSGSKHAEDCLYKIIGMVFEVADLLRDTITLSQAKQSSTEFGKLHFEMEKGVFETFAKIFDQLPTENGLYLLSQLLGRLSTPCPQLETALRQVLTGIFADFPDQVMWNILDIKMRADASKMEQNAGHVGTKEMQNASKMSETIDDIFKNMGSTESMEKYRSYVELGKQLKSFMSLEAHAEFKIDKKFPQLNRFILKERRNGRQFLVPLKSFIVPTLNYGQREKEVTYKDYQTTTHSQLQERKRNSYEIKRVNIESIMQPCIPMQSLQKPVKFSLRATNGQEYSFLAKKGDDLTLDARVSELIQMFDFLLRTTDKTKNEELPVRSFYVIPLGFKRGLIEWIDNLKSFKSCVEPMFKNGERYKIEHLNRNPGYEKLCLDQFNKKWNEMGPPVFHKWFIEHFNRMTDMLSARRTYASSLAVMSIIGNIIGLGDRHCENIQICQKTGEVVHIDLNMIFERGNKLKVPEIVPFRMTREIVDGCGMVKLEGTFKAVAIKTMEIARDNADKLKTIISLFLDDPTVNWNNYRVTKGRNQVQSRERSSKDDRRGDLDNVMKRINFIAQIDGQNDVLPVGAYLEHLIDTASDPKNLSVMWHGWAPHY